jgi:mannosyltransferase OCH1-like enzyme
MVLYVYGGLYCDLDTFCNIPIDEWINNNYDVILSRDDDGDNEDFSIHTFASKEKSKLMYDTIEILKINILNNKINKNNVVELTGEKVLSSIIKNNKKLYNFYSYEKGSNMFNGVASSHLGNYKKWNKYGYIQWTLQEDK